MKRCTGSQLSLLAERAVASRWQTWAGVLLMLLALVSPAFAWQGPAVPGARQRPLGRSWRIAEFHSNLTVMPDGAMLVTEDITAVFTGDYHLDQPFHPHRVPRATRHQLHPVLEDHRRYRRESKAPEV